MLIFIFLLLVALPPLTFGEGWTWTCDPESTFCRKSHFLLTFLLHILYIFYVFFWHFFCIFYIFSMFSFDVDIFIYVTPNQPFAGNHILFWCVDLFHFLSFWYLYFWSVSIYFILYHYTFEGNHLCDFSLDFVLIHNSI